MADQPTPRLDPAPIAEGDRVHWVEGDRVTFTGNVESLNLSRTHALVRLDPPDPDHVQPAEVPVHRLYRGAPRDQLAAVLHRSSEVPAPTTEDLLDRLTTAVDRVADVLENVVGSIDELTTASAHARGTLEDGLAKLTEELHSNSAAVRALVEVQKNMGDYHP